MNRKYLLNALIFLTLYAAGYWLATSFYKDDPTAMNWSDREAYNRKFIADFRQKSSNTTQQQVIQQLHFVACVVGVQQALGNVVVLAFL